MTWRRPNYYLIFDEENAHHPSSFRRCVRYLLRASPDNPQPNEPISIHDDVEVEKYPERVPLRDMEDEQTILSSNGESIDEPPSTEKQTNVRPIIDKAKLPREQGRVVIDGEE